VSNTNGINSNELIKNLEKYRDLADEEEISKSEMIKEYLDMIYTDVDVIVKKVNLTNMFRFIMSDRGFNHVMYKSIIQEFNRWIWEARMKYAEDIDIQIIYRDWSKYLLDVRN
jgi:hypothetical protein